MLGEISRQVDGRRWVEELHKGGQNEKGRNVSTRNLTTLQDERLKSEFALDH